MGAERVPAGVHRAVVHDLLRHLEQERRRAARQQLPVQALLVPDKAHMLNAPSRLDAVEGRRGRS